MPSEDGYCTLCGWWTKYLGKVKFVEVGCGFVRQPHPPAPINLFPNLPTGPPPCYIVATSLPDLLPTYYDKSYYLILSIWTEKVASPAEQRLLKLHRASFQSQTAR